MQVLVNRLALRLSPQRHLILFDDPDAALLPAAQAERLQTSFARGAGHGLLQLGAAEVGQPLPPLLAWWREFSVRYVTALRIRAEPGTAPAPLPAPDTASLQALADAAPPMLGAEYLDADTLRALWETIDHALQAELAASDETLEAFLQRMHPSWHTIGRVNFHLGESRQDPVAPFAFMATYSHRLSAQGRAQHLPLAQALREYAGAAQRAQLLALLQPVQRAASACTWLRALVDSGEIFHPLRWSPAEACRLLADLPALEAAGVLVKMPASWPSQRPSRPRVSATVGSAPPAGIGTQALLDFRMQVSLDGEALSEAEIAALLAAGDGLTLLRGRWVEVDRSRLEPLLARFRQAERLSARDGLPFAEAMRLLSGADLGHAGDARALDPDWSQVSAGRWLADTLQQLRSPADRADIDPGAALCGTLRPYQRDGLHWLHLLSTLGLGACLADDMGLGKTIQLLALLLLRRRQSPNTSTPNLLVVPASLLANWHAEAARFAPSLRLLIAHPSALPAAELKALTPADLQPIDLVVTSYGSLTRLPQLAEVDWQLLALDEAQALKNPNTKQTRAVAALRAHARIALTGTPVENRLGDLWSIFNIINPGLLGSAKQFTAYTRRLAEAPHNPYGPLRELVRPYILRRLKTDRRVIADLPDKTELRAWCGLSRRQAALYQQSVEQLAEQLDGSDGIQRRGLVLAYLMRFKQICNHPAHWLGDDDWTEADSGKLARLRELVEVIAARQEKLLLFTQFKEATAPLAAFLAELFGRPGLVLHGGTPVKQRRALVERFQNDDELPFFVLSLKAGGTGLNLTAASHVVHFDRWWNPAVENQATDRAFRIGQTRNVLVHKFVCRGTVEERIDQLIDSKRQLADQLLEGGAELNLTELGNDELLRLVALDLDCAMKDLT
jgi:superfamily II DNA or RNA helicase